MKVSATSIHRDITDQFSHALLRAELDVYGNDFPSETFRVLKEKETRLYDPSHPVRNAVETLGSVEVVRTIRGALKK